MTNAVFEHPILNSPYELPGRHWELDGAGQAEVGPHRGQGNQPPRRRGNEDIQGV